MQDVASPAYPTFANKTDDALRKLSASGAKEGAVEKH
jgi:hypothetical protein